MSEFGKGLCYCLGLFLAHTDRLNQDLKLYKDMRDKENSGVGDLFSEGRAVQMWFNGASDHLYELQTDGVSEELKARLITLQDKALYFGHSYPEGKPTLKDAHWALQEAKDLLRLIDQERGIQTEKGQWE